VSRWTVSCTRARCRHDVAGASFPAYGERAAIDVTLKDGRRIRLEQTTKVPFADVAEIRLPADPSGGYRVIPLASRPRAELVVTAPVPQWTDPLAGPTLTVRLSGRLGRRALRLAVRIVPFR
jgi:hypothetical protein